MATRDEDMRGKICLITGATSGIGWVTARELAARGATVALVARDADRGAETVAAITRETGNSQVSYFLADLSKQADVRRLAREFTERHARLDVLINNAGAIFPQRRESADGMEMTFALNVLAPFLLTNLLLDTLKASAPSRIVNVASAAHIGARMPFDDLQQTHGYRALRTYGQSKLGLLLLTYELAKRLEGTGVTVNALHPGVVATNFGRGDGGFVEFVMTLMKPFTIDSEKGARTSVYVAASPEIEGVNGRYFDKCKPVRSSAASYDPDAARRLWDICEQLTSTTPSVAPSR